LTRVVSRLITNDAISRATRMSDFELARVIAGSSISQRP
jgi:hypothetical protein